MRHPFLALKLVLFCFATGAAMGDSLPKGINNVEFLVPTFSTAIGVANALENALKKTTVLDDDNVHVIKMNYDDFVFTLARGQPPQSGTIQIPIVSVDPAQSLPDYVKKWQLVGSIAEEPMAIWEPEIGLLNENIEHVKSTEAALKVGVLDVSPGYFAGLYFRKQGIPIELFYVKNLPIGTNLLESGDIQALVGPAISNRPANVVQFAELLKVNFASDVAPAYGYLAFTSPIFDGDEAAALERVLRGAVQDNIYKQRLEERGLSGIFTEAEEWKKIPMMVSFKICQYCKEEKLCNTDAYCQGACEECPRIR